MYQQTWIEWAYERNFIKRPENEDESDRNAEDADDKDIFDKYIDGFKYFFIFLGVFLIFFSIVFIMIP